MPNPADPKPCFSESLNELASSSPPPHETRTGISCADSSPETILPNGAAGAAPSVVPLVPGYEILGELGRGGMGVVYQARQVRLKRLVALKMILAGGHAGPGELERFRAEAEAVARLQHPNIVQVYEVGEHNGLPFLALEFVEGGNLAQRLAGQPRPPQEAAAIVATLAHAVEAAHQAGVIHRDLKPANILVRKRKAEG